MDSTRIIINNMDLSTSAEILQTTPVKGFTVVKAPKGPKTPIYLPKNSAAKMKDIFGVSSKDFPELFEAETFNTGYDLYVSAPYDSATVPVAYITNKGVLPAAEPITYSTEIEEYVLGKSFDAPEDLYKNVKFLIPAKDAGFIVEESVTAPECAYDANEKSLKITLHASIVKELDTQDYNTPDDSGEPAAIAENDANIAIEALRLENLPKELSSIKGKDITFKSNKVYCNSKEIGTLDKYNCVITINSSDLTSSIETAYGNNTNNPKDIVVYVLYEIKDNLSDDTEKFNIHGVIFPKFPGAGPLHLKFTGDYSSSTDLYTKNLFRITAWEEGAFHNASSPVIISGSLDDFAKDGFGAVIGFGSNNASYMEQDLVGIHVRKPFTEQSQLTLDSISDVVLYGGSKVISETEPLNWETAESEEFSDVDIFFAPSTNIDDSFFGLAGYHELAGFIFNKSVAPTLISEETPLNAGNRYWNICNEAVIEYNYNKFYSPLTGARALMQAKIIDERWGGVAPMYLNTVGLGGQLSVLPGARILGLRYTYDKHAQKALDALNYNPIIKDSTYGVMVVGQKTCVSGLTSDWSYIGHVSAFLKFQKEVKNNVMIPQLGKANNDYYRNLRKQQVEALLEKRITGNNRIWAAAKVDTSTADGVNDAQARRERKFVINVMVKVDVFSEYVELNFTNFDQDYSL